MSKARLLLLCPLLLFLSAACAQYVPDAFSYQAVARNAGGNEIVDQNLTVRIGIAEESPDGILAYEEIHDVVTNAFGLFSLEIGRGLATGNSLYTSLTEVVWGTQSHFMRVEIDTPESGGFEFLGSTELLSVPYAYHAISADSAPEVDGDAHNELISAGFVTGTDISIQEGSGVTIIDAAPIAYKTWQQNATGVYQNTTRVGVGISQPNSSLHVQGSYSAGVATFVAINDGTTDNFSVNDTHQVVICNITDGDMNILLPSAVSSVGRIYCFRKYFAGVTGSYALAIVAESGQTVDGSTQKVYNDPNAEYISIISDGAGWYVIAHSKE